jgi:dTDP-glucose 4,6-dehydratase
LHVFIAGGAGFIGSNFVRRILTDGYDGHGTTTVTILDKLTYAGNIANLDPVAGSPRMRFVEGDICDADLLAELVPGHDAVVNFAAETHVDRSIAGAAEFVRTNVLGAQTLFQACLDAKVPRVLHVSTDEVYGSIPDGAWTEEHVLEPNSPYAAAKAAADLLARSYARTYGLDITVTRCSNNYGPYQFPEKVIPLFVTNLLDGLPVPLYGDGLNVREWLHVDDHCRGIMVALERGRAGEVYNLGGGTELSNRELTELLLNACGATWDSVRMVEDRKAHDRRYAIDCTKATEELGYAPSVDFALGLAETVEWYRDNRSWWEPLAQGARTTS